MGFTHPETGCLEVLLTSLLHTEVQSTPSLHRDSHEVTTSMANALPERSCHCLVFGVPQIQELETS